MIYILEDEASIRQLVVYTLTSVGLEAQGFEDAEAFFAAVRKTPPELALLDIMLPGEDGLTVLRKLRESRATANLPIIMLTAKSTEFDKVTGLNLGADDYVLKPFGLMELVARVKSLLRRAEAGKPARVAGDLTVGALTLSESRHEVTVEGRSVQLSLKEFATLSYLLRNPNIVLTRDQIMNAVWGYDYDGESRTVDVHVRSMRAKLGVCADAIETVRGVGYRASQPT